MSTTTTTTVTTTRMNIPFSFASDGTDDQNGSVPPIFVIDASGSTTNLFGDLQQIETFKLLVEKFMTEENCRILGIKFVERHVKTRIIHIEMAAVCNYLRERGLPLEARFIFWNSRGCGGRQSFFNNGTKVYETISISIVMSQLEPAFGEFAMTEPDIGFESIPRSWLSSKDVNEVIFLTDGEMYSGMTTKMVLKNRLISSIRQLQSQHHIRLTVWTFENLIRNYGMENTTRAAGSDVFAAFQESNMTNTVVRFVCYTPNFRDGYIMIENRPCPPGFLPFGSEIFKESELTGFFSWVENEIQNSKDEIGVLCRIANNLAGMLAFYQSAKGPRSRSIIMGMAEALAYYFMGTQLPVKDALQVIRSQIDDISNGQQKTAAELQLGLRSKYNAANESLSTNAYRATGCSLYGAIGFPIIGSADILHIAPGDVEKLVVTEIGEHKLSVMKIGENLIPVLPALTGFPNSEQEQCVRQLIRGFLSKIVDLNNNDESMIYVFLGHVLWVMMADGISERTRTIFRFLGQIMLRKARGGGTELSYFEAGNLPTNSKASTIGFHRYMNMVNQLLGWEPIRPMTVWYAICLALDNQQLITKQLMHCWEHIHADFPNLSREHAGTLLTLLPRHQLSEMDIQAPPPPLEYYCPVTLESTEETGGYIIIPHGRCAPRLVIESSVVENNQLDFCPYCRTHRLAIDSYQRVAPFAERQMMNVQDIQLVNNPFNSATKLCLSRITADTFKKSLRENSDATAPSCSTTTTATVPDVSISRVLIDARSGAIVNSKPGVVVVARGNVGGGKTTSCNALKTSLEEDIPGVRVLIVSMDNMVVEARLVGQFIDYPSFEMEISSKILAFATDGITQEHTNPDPSSFKVLIVDSCGISGVSPKDKIFGHYLDGWQRIAFLPNYEQSDYRYQSWCLYNVLKRPSAAKAVALGEPPSNLNPEDSGFDTCVKVHTKKGQQIYRKRFVAPLQDRSDLTVEDALEILRPAAEGYNNYLSTNVDRLSTETRTEKYINSCKALVLRAGQKMGMTSD
jgi:hypothetical protein